ncbi:MAG: DUF1572 family protein [Sphingobacteriales bacterium]|nr:DUF1572 family protein [Sphingobacteriales bacterium]
MITIGKEYLQTVIRRLKYYKDIAEKAFEQLDEKDFHYMPNSASNSVAIIVQHMVGNMLSRFTNFLTEDGEKEWRQRDDEFEIHNYSRQQVIDLWEKGWKCCLDALESLHEEDLLKTIYIRKESLTVIDALNRQLAHYPHHIGQILYIGKMLKSEKWKSLSIPKGQSQQYNQSSEIKDPAKKY